MRIGRHTHEQEALDLAQAAIDSSKTTGDRLGGIADQALAVADESRGLAEEAVKQAEESGRRAGRLLEIARVLLEHLAQLPDSEVLGPKELEEVAQQFPNWSINVGFSGGEPHKTYSRTMEDFTEEALSDRDHWLHLTDEEYFDGRLLDIFDGLHGTGDLGGDGHFTITAERPGPITLDDVMRLAAAEQYLQRAGYLPLPELPTQPTTN